MRAYIIAAALALSVIGSARGSVVDSGADAQKSCQFLVEGSLGDADEARAAGACAGMIETAMVFAPNMPADSRACAPAQGSVLESAKALLRYLDKNSGSTERGWNYACDRSPQRCLAVRRRRCHSTGQSRTQTKKACGEKTSQ